MSATVRSRRDNAVGCIGQISKLSNHGTLGAGLNGGDESCQHCNDELSESSSCNGDVEVLGRFGQQRQKGKSGEDEGEEGGNETHG